LMLGFGFSFTADKQIPLARWSEKKN